MNFYYAAFVFHSVWLSFSPPVSAPTRTCSASAGEIFNFTLYLWIWYFKFRTSPPSKLHLVFFLSFFSFFTLNDNSNWIVAGNFPNVLPGKQECRWTLDFSVFNKFGPFKMNWHCHLPVFTLALSNNLNFICCYFGGFPKLEALQNRDWLFFKFPINKKNL